MQLALLGVVGLPEVEELKNQKDDLVSFTEFVEMLEGRPVDSGNAAPAEGKNVPRNFAVIAAHTALADDMLVEGNKEAMRAISLFVDEVSKRSTAKGLKPLPTYVGERPFATVGFLQVLELLSVVEQEPISAPSIGPLDHH